MKTTTATTYTNLDIGNDHITYEDSSLERKIRLVTEGLSHQYSDRLYNKTQKEMPWHNRFHIIYEDRNQPI